VLHTVPLNFDDSLEHFLPGVEHGFGGAYTLALQTGFLAAAACLAARPKPAAAPEIGVESFPLLQPNPRAGQCPSKRTLFRPREAVYGAVNHLSYGKDGTELTERFEGLRLTAYQDQVGLWTIGLGHTGSDVYPGLSITRNDATTLLLHDIAPPPHA
jgi:Phage lysozyme